MCDTHTSEVDNQFPGPPTRAISNTMSEELFSILVVSCPWCTDYVAYVLAPTWEADCQDSDEDDDDEGVEETEVAARQLARESIQLETHSFQAVAKALAAVTHTKKGAPICRNSHNYSSCKDQL